MAVELKTIESLIEDAIEFEIRHDAWVLKYDTVFIDSDRWTAIHPLACGRINIHGTMMDWTAEMQDAQRRGKNRWECEYKVEVA